MKLHPEKLGDYIQQRRDELGFPSRLQFAKKIKLDPSTVERIENADTRSPGLEAIVKIASGLGVTEQFLIDIYKGKPTENESEVVLKNDLYSAVIKTMERHFTPGELQEKANKMRAKHGEEKR